MLFFPPGTYIVHHTIELGAHTTVLGAGPGSVLLAKPKDPGGHAFNMLSIGDADNVRVRDLVLDGNSAQQWTEAGQGGGERRLRVPRAAGA